MRILLCLSFYLFAVAVVSADGNSNAVNERITVTSAEMESHWRVDCATSWARVIELREKMGSPDCALPPELQRELKLCAFIYQPPGQQLTQSGPDYQSATAQSADGTGCIPKAPDKQ